MIREVKSGVGRVVIFFDHFGRTAPCELEIDKIEKLGRDEWDVGLRRIRAALFGT